MKFFYYVRNLGRLYPQASADHPTSQLVKPRNIVGEVHTLKPEHLHLTLRELMELFPEPAQ